MRLKYLADADLNAALVPGVVRAEPFIDFEPASMAGLRSMPDPAVLRVAAEEGRILVTHDIGTMPRHFGEFLTAGRRSPKVFLLPQNLRISALPSTVSYWRGSVQMRSTGATD